MEKDSLFWRLVAGELPPPPCALTLGGKIETEFEGKPEFANPVGHIQGGFLAAMLNAARNSHSCPASCTRTDR
jgi:hypothetical protein